MSKQCNNIFEFTSSTHSIGETSQCWCSETYRVCVQSQGSNATLVQTCFGNSNTFKCIVGALIGCRYAPATWCLWKWYRWPPPNPPTSAAVTPSKLPIRSLKSRPLLKQICEIQHLLKRHTRVSPIWIVFISASKVATQPRNTAQICSSAASAHRLLRRLDCRSSLKPIYGFRTTFLPDLGSLSG